MSLRSCSRSTLGPPLSLLRDAEHTALRWETRKWLIESPQRAQAPSGWSGPSRSSPRPEEVGVRRRQVTVNDLMQRGYVYELTEPAGRNFHPLFRPELTPKQLLQLGVFGGKYMTDCRAEFPASWFARAKLCPDYHDPKLNCFGVNASQLLSVWRRKGWLSPEDPRGWFQWYCRYYRGRSCPDDARQIRRWQAMRRHVAQLRKSCRQGDWSCRPRQRQALLHWAYDSRLI